MQKNGIVHNVQQNMAGSLLQQQHLSMWVTAISALCCCDGQLPSVNELQVACETLQQCLIAKWELVTDQTTVTYMSS